MSAHLLEDATKLAMPCLIIWGEHDMAPVGEGREAAARLPIATFVTLEGVGHFPFLESPDVTAKLLLDFFG